MLVVVGVTAEQGDERVNNDFIKGLLLCLTLAAVTVKERLMLERTREYSEFVNKANIIYFRQDITLRIERQSQVIYY